MTSIAIRTAGICSTLQDLGRTGYRAYGVPASGALDTVALTLANALVGNAPDQAGIEMLYSGVTCEVLGDAVRLAVGGADATLIGCDGMPRRKLSSWESLIVHHGEALRVQPFRATAAAYLAIEGGFEVEPVMGSLSTHLRGALGGWQGRALRVGDVLPLRIDRPSPGAGRRYPVVPELRAPEALRVMLGPQNLRFERASTDTLLQTEYSVSAQSDRSGLRLEGAALQHVDGYDATSEGVVAGSIQVPGSGLPMILIGDHPTVGGYPKIATIISADIAAAGRLRIGSRVRFKAVSEADAKAARTQLKTTIQDMLSRMTERRE